MVGVVAGAAGAHGKAWAGPVAATGRPSMMTGPPYVSARFSAV